MVQMLRGIVLLAIVLAACSTTPSLHLDSGVAEVADASCASNAECDDHIACTSDLCLVGGRCDHRADNTLCVSPQVCVIGEGCRTMGTMTCNTMADCDDHFSCTTDLCHVSHTCRHEAHHDQCPTGQTCDLMRGCTMGMTGRCTMASECNDMFDCTDDQCGVDGMCVHVAQNSRCPMGRRCLVGMGCIVEHPCSSAAECDDHLACNGAETCSELACVGGVAPTCDDMDSCTVDTCQEGDAGMVCQHMRSMTCMPMVRSGLYNLSMQVMYSCFGLGMEVVHLQVGFFNFAVTTSHLNVTMGPSGGPAMMTGAVPTSSSFDVTGTNTGDCNEIYRLMGTFTDDTHFMGTLTLNFSGFGCALAMCSAQSWMVRGTLVM